MSNVIQLQCNRCGHTASHGVFISDGDIMICGVCFDKQLQEEKNMEFCQPNNMVEMLAKAKEEGYREGFVEGIKAVEKRVHTLLDNIVIKELS